MSHIVLFQPRISDQFSPAYKTYTTLYENDIINNPIIFCDSCEILTDSNICIFNAYFLRQHFFDCYVLMDFQDIKYLNNFQNRKLIIVYNELFDDITNLESKHILIELESDRLKIIKDIIND